MLFFLRKHDKLLIPVSGIHRDDRYYPNPDQFNPDNFSKEARQARNPFTFIGMHMVNQVNTGLMSSFWG